MADERMAVDWSHTSLVCSVIANTARDPKKRSKPFVPDDFNPLAKIRSGPEERVSIADLKHLFVKD